MKKRVVHCKGADPWDVYVGRPSVFGNPWSHKADTLAKFRTKTVEQAVNNFEIWLNGTGFKDVLQEERKRLLERLPELTGKVLACWCDDDKPCHARVLVAKVDSIKKDEQ